jgi:hypothetical protein
MYRVAVLSNFVVSRRVDGALSGAPGFVNRIRQIRSTPVAGPPAGLFCGNLSASFDAKSTPIRDHRNRLPYRVRRRRCGHTDRWPSANELSLGDHARGARARRIARSWRDHGKGRLRARYGLRPLKYGRRSSGLGSMVKSMLVSVGMPTVGSILSAQARAQVNQAASSLSLTARSAAACSTQKARMSTAVRHCSNAVLNVALRCSSIARRRAFATACSHLALRSMSRRRRSSAACCSASLAAARRSLSRCLRAAEIRSSFSTALMMSATIGTVKRTAPLCVNPLGGERSPTC